MIEYFLNHRNRGRHRLGGGRQLRGTLMMCAILTSLSVSAAKGKADKELSKLEKESIEQDERGESEYPTLAERVASISHHRFLKRKRFELSPHLAFTTQDAFFRRWMVGARFVYHFNESLSLDLGGDAVVISQPLASVRSPDEDFLEQQRNGSGGGNCPTAFFGDAGIRDERCPLGALDLSLSFAPLYGKMALAAERVVHFDLFGSLGIGALFDVNAGNDSAQTRALVGSQGFGFNPALVIGGGTRIILNRFFAIRLDFKDYMILDKLRGDSGVQVRNFISFHFGASFFFPLGFEHPQNLRSGVTP